MRIYEEYLEGLDRELAIENAKEELSMARFDFMLEMVDRKYEINCKNAELKVLMEGGTYDDLEYLYMEAKKEQKEEKQGIIATIVTGITNVIQSIINAINNFFNKKKTSNEDPEATKNYPIEAVESSSRFCSKFQELKNTIGDMSTKEKVIALGKTATVLAGCIIGINGASKGVKAVKNKVADEQIGVMKAAMELFKEKADSIEQKIIDTFGLEKKDNKDDKKDDKKEEPNNSGNDNQPEQKTDTNDTNDGKSEPEQKEKKDTNENNSDDSKSGSFASLVTAPIRGLVKAIKSLLSYFGVAIKPDENDENNAEDNKDDKKDDKKEEPNNSGNDNQPEQKTDTNDTNDGKSEPEQKEKKDTNENNGQMWKLYAKESNDDYWFDNDLFDESVDESSLFDGLDFDSLLELI